VAAKTREAEASAKTNASASVMKKTEFLRRCRCVFTIVER